MVNVFLLACTLFLGVSTILLLVVLWEVYRPGTAMVLRKWRYAYSKRTQIQSALRQARIARGEAAATRRQADQTEELAAQKAESAERRCKQAEEFASKAKLEAEQYAWKVKQEAEEAQRRSQRIADDRYAKAIEHERVVSNAADRRVAHMGSYLIAEQCAEHIKTIKANNYHAKEKRIFRSIEVAAKNGYKLPTAEKNRLVRMLESAHEDAVRAEGEREEQQRIKAMMREEAQREAEIQRAIRQAEKEEAFKRRALQEAMRLLGNTHSAELDRLKAELAEAQAKAQRAKSMAQLTRAGHLYIVSNVGSFGRDVFKIGMTRRLEPMDRIWELSDASVPFDFDVHAMISAEDAPKLEAALHRELNKHRINRVNLRKEFFRIDLDAIIAAVRQHHGDVEYVADAEALEYIESMEPDDVAELDARLERQLATVDPQDD